MKRNDNVSSSSMDVIEKPSFISSADEAYSRRFLLQNKTIGISISESDNISELGYSVMHLKDVMLEVAKYLLSLGAKLAYGGDMRKGGFTELMFDLLMQYKDKEKLNPNERFFNYLAWPIYLNLKKETEANLKNKVTFKKIEPAIDVGMDAHVFLAPDSPKNVLLWAKNLTKMRKEMSSDCDARIFIGGRTRAFKGKNPGILEELLIALKAKQPVYLIGAFGGISKDAIDALAGLKNETFTNDYYLEDNQYKAFFHLHNSLQNNDSIDYSDYFNYLKGLGFNGLSKLNGLTIEDNKRLAATPHINEIIFLIIKGLTNVLNINIPVLSS